MFDLHTHSTLSDGDLLPAELIRRAAVLGYETIAITDHVDKSTIAGVLTALLHMKESARLHGIRLLCGVEITHVPPVEIQDLAKEAKNRGADIVVVHGETPVEPVVPGTNHAACLCTHVDILAHPGMITIEDAKEARSKGILLELTSRAGHNRTNGHVVRVARETGCGLVVNSDAHAPSDLLDESARILIGRGAGLTPEEWRHLTSLNIDQWLTR